jgi:virginiamycin B lyase
MGVNRAAADYSTRVLADMSDPTTAPAVGASCRPLRVGLCRSRWGRIDPMAPAIRQALLLLIGMLLSGRSSASEIRRIDDHPIADLTTPGYADFLVADGDSVWATNEGRVERLALGNAGPAAAVAVPNPCGAMAVGFRSLWVADCKSQSIYRIALESHQVTAVIHTGLADPEDELSLATGAGSVWVMSDAKGILTRIDPESNRIAARIPVPPNSYCAAYAFGSVWITTTGQLPSQQGSVQRIDPKTNRVIATIETGPQPRFLAVGEGGVWTLNQGDGSVTRVDPRKNKVAATIALGVSGSGGDIATGAGKVWVRATRTLLTAIEPATNSVSAVYSPPSGSGAARVAGRYVWVTAHDVHKVWVIAP